MAEQWCTYASVYKLRNRDVSEDDTSTHLRAMQRASMQQRDGTLGHAAVAAREAFPQQAFEVLVLQQKAGRATLRQLGERSPRARLIHPFVRLILVAPPLAPARNTPT